MKKITIALVAVLSLVVVGCGSSSSSAKKTVCTTKDTSQTSGMNKIVLEAKNEKVKKLEMSMEIDSATLGMSAEDAIKAAEKNSKEIEVDGLTYDFSEKGDKVVATIIFNLEKIDFDNPTISSQLSGLGGDEIKDIKLSEFKKQLKEMGMKCK